MLKRKIWDKEGNINMTNLRPSFDVISWFQKNIPNLNIGLDFFHLNYLLQITKNMVVRRELVCVQPIFLGGGGGVGADTGEKESTQSLEK